MTPTPPRDETLKRYGLSRDDFDGILTAQGGVCAICQGLPNGRWNIDHEHVRGWAKMTPNRRKMYVRGILCWRCNRYYAGPGITISRAQSMMTYLLDYEERKRWLLKR